MAGSPPSVAFIVPALNEQANLEATVRDIFRALEGKPFPVSVWIFNDGSTDKTGAVADRLAAADPRVKVVHNPSTRGLGWNYFRGVDLATEEYVVMIPGDNEIPEAAIRPLMAEVGAADLIIPYMTGSEARPLGRRFLSRTFVVLVNLLYGLDVRYYNGPCVLRRELVRRVPLRTDGFAYMAAVLVTLLRAGCSFREPAIPLQVRRHGGSKALRLRNVLTVASTLARLFVQVRLSRSEVVLRQ